MTRLFFKSTIIIEIIVTKFLKKVLLYIDYSTELWGGKKNKKIRIPFIRKTSSGIQGSQEQVLSRVQFN